MHSCRLVVLPGDTERVDVRDVEVAGEVVANTHAVPGLVPVNTRMEATQTPAVSTIKLELSSHKTEQSLA